MKIMRFKKFLYLLGAGRTRAWHHHGSHTSTSPWAILLHSYFMSTQTFPPSVYLPHHPFGQIRWVYLVILYFFESRRLKTMTFPTKLAHVCALCETTPEMYSISMSPFLTVRFTSRELIQGRGPVHSLQKWAASHLL